MESHATSGSVALLSEDPELAVGLSGDELATAQRLVVVPALTVERGEWNVRAIQREPSLGLLLLDGLVTVSVTLGDRVTSQLHGRGDLLYDVLPPDVLLAADLNFFVSDRAHVAVLDARFIAAVRRWPALLLALHERLRVQDRRLAVHAAIGKLRRVEDRVLALLWQLAERWGRVSADGVVVPLMLTHETLGRLAGAERPTVSLALRELAGRGAVTRRDDGAFVLHDASRQLLAPSVEPPESPLAVIRTLDVPPAADPSAKPPTIDIVALRARIAALQEELPERSREVEERLASARASAQRSAATRARLAERREPR